MSTRELLVSVSYVVGWSVVSSGLILLNKYILSNLDFHYPLTLSRHATLTVSPQKWQLSPPPPTRVALPPHAAWAWASAVWRARC
jgi:hypothetical protein